MREIIVQLARKHSPQAFFSASIEDGVLVAPRGTKKQNGTVLVNILYEPKSISLPGNDRYTDILTAQKVNSSLHLEPYEVKVLQK